MRPGGGKAKGASFEREICRQLSLWISNETQEDVFWRSAMSGGRSTVAHAKGKRLANQAGDITAIHPIGQPMIDRFILECKDYTDLNFIGLLKGTGNLIQFWCETVLAAARYGKQPFLVAHQARQPTMVCLSAGGLSYFQPLRIVVTAPCVGMNIVLFEDFLRTKPPHWVDPERVHNEAHDKGRG